MQNMNYLISELQEIKKHFNKATGMQIDLLIHKLENILEKPDEHKKSCNCKKTVE